jgi:outer membrane protein assembly factor BamB
MKKFIKIQFCALLLSAVNIQAQTAKIITGFNHVESVAADDGFLYAADIGKVLDPVAKDGDGKIIKMDDDGNIINADFVKEKLNAPKGLAIYKAVLYLTDIDRVLAIDIKTGLKIYEIDFSNDTKFLNDIAVWDDQTLFVSATDKSKLFKADLATKTYAEVKTSVVIPGINGLCCRKKADRLYVNGFGTDNHPNGIVGYINLKDNSFTQINLPMGYYDGIALKNGTLYVGDWVAFENNGIVREVLTYNTDKAALTTKSLRIPGPADFTISGDNLIVPAMLTGEIYIFKFN